MILSQQNILQQALEHHRSGRLSQAEVLYNQILSKEPAHPDALLFLGMLAHQVGKVEIAVELITKAVNSKPDYFEAHFRLGYAFMELGKLEDAVACFRQTLTLKPDYFEAHFKLGYAFMELGKLEDAVACFRQTLTLKPGYVDALINIGVIFKNQGRLEKAVDIFRQVLTLKPNFAMAHYNLGVALKDLGKLEEAEISYNHAIELEPDYTAAHYNLGNVLISQDRIDEAVTSFRRTLTLQPDFAMAHSNLLLCLNYLPNQSVSKYLDEVRQFERTATRKVKWRFSNWSYTDKTERLCIGLVSGDFRTHPVGYFLENMLANIYTTKIDLIAYPTHPKEDELTTRIRPHFVEWKPLVGLDDEAAARLIHNDGVNILLDLSGHTGHNRLPVFAWKPAPVQATWLGYFASTGITEMDYIITDPVSVPESHQNQFTERVWYLPDTRFCFSPPANGGELLLSPLPALHNGYITFGSFQNLSKINDKVLATWGKIHQLLPQSKFRLQDKKLNSLKIQNQIYERLAQNGIAPERVTLKKAAPRVNYLAAHSHIDIILDTFPYPGGTTTCEALWMGVPTLTLAGKTMLARQGASMLSCAGLTDWIAIDEDDYVSKALAQAGNLEKLAKLRKGLRQKVLTSPLFDWARFTRNFETAMWGMWHQFRAEY